MKKVDLNCDLGESFGNYKLGMDEQNGEVFADRAYMEDGTLVPRSQEGAMITDEEEAVARVLEMVQKGTVTAITGKKIEVQADSICVHGDGQKALLFVQKIRSELEKAGVVIAPMKEVIVGES